MKKILPKFQGFTLVELLVVISIIAILAVIGITVFSGVQKNARDAKRKADVQAIATALEAQKLATSSAYPTPPVQDFWFASGVKPIDPDGTTQYNVTWNTTPVANTQFCVCSKTLDNSSGANASAGASGVCTFTGTLTLYCIANQQ